MLTADGRRTRAAPCLSGRDGPCVRWASGGGRWWVSRRVLVNAVVLLLAAMVFGAVTLVRAQETPGTEILELQVDLWPQFDDPRLLVIYKGTTASPPTQPLRFPLPAGAEVNAVAHLDDQDQLLNEPWESQASGNRQVITFTPATTRFQLEYYIDVIGSGPEKSFSLDIDVGDQPVGLLGISVQQPAGASSLQGQPPLSGPVAGAFGLSYFARQIENVRPGQTVKQSVTYSKPDDSLSVEKIGPPASGLPATQPQQDAVPSDSGFATNLADRSATRFWLPIAATVVIVIGLVLLGLGALRARRAQSLPPTPEPRSRGRRVRPRRADVAEGAARFCHVCGAPFESEDRFCAECGTARKGI